MCLNHWRMVPQPVKDLIWKHYRPGQEIDKNPSIDYIATAFVSICCVALKEGRSLPTLDPRRAPGTANEMFEAEHDSPEATHHKNTTAASNPSTATSSNVESEELG